MDPVSHLSWKRPKRVEQVDPRVVINPRQARELLTALTYVGRRNSDRGAHLVGFFAGIYYSAARPAEMVNLRETDCKLPDDGWGELTPWESRPAAGSRWTDSGEVHDRRGLKHRAAKDSRPVPVPPALVTLLRAHIERFGLAADGRLFRSPGGGVVGSATYARVWHAARALAFTPAQVASPLAARPYDLRHAAVSMWLNAGVPAAEVAGRAGHSVEVLNKVYAKCIDGQRDTAVPCRTFDHLRRHGWAVRGVRRAHRSVEIGGAGPAGTTAPASVPPWRVVDRPERPRRP